MSAIKVSHLFSRFGERVVHENISFEVAEKEIFSIIGSSGSGKSTLLKEMILLQKPSEGEIEIFGRDILAFDEEQKKDFSKNLGVLFQSSALFSSLTVGENIGLLLKEHAGITGSFADELISYKISLVGLPHFAKELYPSELSGGMKKRAALARALALEPKLLFLDEPTSGLDPISSRAFDKLILSLNKALGVTFVIASHDVRSVTDISSKIMALHEGKIVFLGNAAEAAKSSHPFLKSFFYTK